MQPARTHARWPATRHKGKLIGGGLKTALDRCAKLFLFSPASLIPIGGCGLRVQRWRACDRKKRDRCTGLANAAHSLQLFVRRRDDETKPGDGKNGRSRSRRASKQAGRQQACDPSLERSAEEVGRVFCQRQSAPRNAADSSYFDVSRANRKQQLHAQTGKRRKRKKIRKLDNSKWF